MRAASAAGPRVVHVGGHALRKNTRPVVGAQLVVERRDHGLQLPGVDGRVVLCVGRVVDPAVHHVGNDDARATGQLCVEFVHGLQRHPFELPGVADGVVGSGRTHGDDAAVGPPRRIVCAIGCTHGRERSDGINGGQEGNEAKCGHRGRRAKMRTPRGEMSLAEARSTPRWEFVGWCSHGGDTICGAVRKKLSVSVDSSNVNCRFR